MGLFIMSGPSGVGKSSLVKELVKNDSTLVHARTHTTRPRRDGESLDYHFVDLSSFMYLVDSNAFIEHVSFCGYSYGSSKKEFSGKKIISILEPTGAIKLANEWRDDTCLIFILPGMPVDTSERMQERGASEKEIEVRNTAFSEMCASIPLYDYIVINDDVDDAVCEIERIIEEKEAAWELAARISKSPRS